MAEWLSYVKNAEMMIDICVKAKPSTTAIIWLRPVLPCSCTYACARTLPAGRLLSPTQHRVFLLFLGRPGCTYLHAMQQKENADRIGSTQH